MVEATPGRRGSGAQAALSARPSGLERGLGQVMVVPAAARHVERGAGRPGERLEGVLDELERKLADPLAVERQIDDGVRPPADIDDGTGQ